MRDTDDRGWQRWRVTVADAAAPDLGNRFARTRRPAPPPEPLSATAEEPGPDGIRHELVARVKRAIDAGYYDSDEIWDRCEAKLVRDVEGRM